MKELWLPYPPSVNHAFRNLPGGGRAKASHYRAWRKEAALELMAQRPPKYKGQYTLEISARRPDNRMRDIDNLIKPISDALVAAGIVRDDSDCVRVTAEWSDKAQRVGCMIRVEPWVLL